MSFFFVFFFFKQKTAYEISACLVGSEMCIRDRFNYVMDNETARIFANKLEDMVEFLIPKYAQEGKTSLVIAVGCTGGKHRSVTIARELYSRIARNGEYGFRLEHRDVDKDRLLKK